MPSPTHITTYAADALALLTSRYSKSRPDPTRSDEMALIKTTAADAAATITAADVAKAWVIYQPFSGLTVSRALNLPDPSTCPGVRVIARALDGSLTTAIGIVWTPAAGNIERGNVSAATFTQNKDVAGVGGSLEFLSDGAVWRALS